MQEIKKAAAPTKEFSDLSKHNGATVPKTANTGNALLAALYAGPVLCSDVPQDAIETLQSAGYQIERRTQAPLFPGALSVTVWQLRGAGHG